MVEILNIAPADSVTLIRVNPDFPLLSSSGFQKNKFISIQGKTLETLELIDQFISGTFSASEIKSPTSKLYCSGEDDDSSSDYTFVNSNIDPMSSSDDDGEATEEISMD